MNNSISKKITYILENIQYMNKDTKVVLLNIIMNYIDNSDEDPDVVETDVLTYSTNGTHINLDKLDQRTIEYIYDVIHRRMTILNTKK
jgi:hypothetical protein